MNALDLFKSFFQTNNPGGELITINGRLMAKIRGCSSYEDVELQNKTYARIKQCVENRQKNKMALFVCSCGVCTGYLMAQMYNNIIIPKPLDDDDSILNQALNEMKQEIINEIPTKSSDNNPLDNVIIIFGKHKDKTYKYAFDNDREYCIWCIESLAIERHKGSRINDNMVAFVSYIKNKIYKNVR